MSVKNNANNIGKNTGKKKKIIVVSIIVLLLASLIMVYLAQRGNSGGTLVTTQALTMGDVEQKISVAGNISGTDSAEISSNLPYEIISINYKVGDKVEQGSILASLNDTVLSNELDNAVKDLELTQLQFNEQNKSQVDSSTTAVELQIKQAEIDLEEARRQLEIKKTLLDSGGIPQEEYNQAQLVVERAVLALDTANENLRKTKSEIAKALDNAAPKQSQSKTLEMKRAYIEQKKEDLDKVNIKSPIAGTITRVNAKLGRLATETTGTTSQSRALFIIENLDNLIMKISISEYDIGKITLGQTVQIGADVLGSDKINGVISAISPTGELKEGSASREMVIPVEIQVTDRDPRLIAGISAQASIEIEKAVNVLKIPIDAILIEKDKSYVFVAKDGEIKKIPVTTGVESNIEVEISGEGLQVGDQIVMNPKMEFTDGMKVKVTEAPMTGQDEVTTDEP